MLNTQLTASVALWYAYLKRLGVRSVTHKSLRFVDAAEAIPAKVTVSWNFIEKEAVGEIVISKIFS